MIMSTDSKQAKEMNRKLKAATFSLFVVTLSASPVFAEDVSWQKNNAAILTNNSVIDDALRWLAFNITKLFCMLADICESLWDKTFGFIDLTNYESVNAIIVQLKPVLVAVTCLCCIALGIMYIVKQERKPIVQNIILGILAVSCSTFIFTTANSLVTSFKDGIINTGSDTESYQLVNDNIIDLVAIDKSGSISSLNYNAGKGIKHNAGIQTKSDFDELDFNETLNWSNKSKGQEIYGWSDTFNNYMRYRAVKVNETYAAVENYNGLLTSDIGNEFYYRYSFDFWSCILQLFALVLIFLSLSYKNVRIAYELVVSRIMAYMYAADISNGERLKQILCFIRDTYITLCVSILCVKLYEVSDAAITSFGITGIEKGIVSVFIAYAVIDGPNLVERLLGMDAGLKSSLGRTIAIFGMAKSGARIATRSVKGAAGAAANTGMAAATGKTAAQRKAESGYASIGEKLGKKAYEATEGKKNDASTVMNGGSDDKASSNTSSQGNIMNDSNKTSASESRDGVRTSLGGGYDASAVMDNVSGGSGFDTGKGAENARSHMNMSSSPSEAINVMNDNNKTNAAESRDSVRASLGSGYDTSVMDNVSGGSGFDTGKGIEAASHMNMSSSPSKATNIMNESGSSLKPASKTARFSNPEFSQAVKNLAPDKNASIGERKDFNRQVNNIVRGNHSAIKPDKNAKADYKFRNYEKALKLEKAYKNVPKEGEKK